MSDGERAGSDDRDERTSAADASEEGSGAHERKSWRRMSREEIMRGLEDYQVKQRANRRRLTGDDVQEMLRERRAGRRQRLRERTERRLSSQRPPRDVGRTVRMSLGAALLLGALGTGALVASTGDETEARSRANERTIAFLKGDIRVLESRTWDETDAAELEERLARAVEQAGEKGEEVARAQNVYQEILVDLDDVEPSGDEDTAEVYAPVQEHRATLVDLFDESARIVKDEDSHRPGADLAYGAGEIDVLDPWYVRYTDETRTTHSKASLNSWELVAVTPRVSAPDTVDVAWLNRDASSGEVLAWGRAAYNADTEKFHSLYVGLTAVGERPAEAGEGDED
ncbi:hypothetical protein [Nocardiopsis alba]|uniref:hypothetical protein n=1 Tax=Nocardiopsis alba TaxID=53437 RepID=UPI0035E011B8